MSARSARRRWSRRARTKTTARSRRSSRRRRPPTGWSCSARKPRAWPRKSASAPSKRAAPRKKPPPAAPKAAAPAAEEAAAKAAKPGTAAPSAMRAHMHKPQPGEAATEDDDSANRRRGIPGRAAVKPAPTARRDEPKRRTGKLSVSQALVRRRRRAHALPRRGQARARKGKAPSDGAATTGQDRARRHSAGNHHSPGARQPHGRARRRRHQERS